METPTVCHGFFFDADRPPQFWNAVKYNPGAATDFWKPNPFQQYVGVHPHVDIYCCNLSPPVLISVADIFEVWQAAYVCCFHFVTAAGGEFDL